MTKERPMDVHNYSTIQPLAAYIDRIGAEQLNQKTFIKRKYHGHYYEEKCIIKLVPDLGEVYCSDSNFAPTKEEKKAIVDLFPLLRFDVAIRASAADSRKKIRELEAEHRSKCYEFLSEDGQVIMLQERRMIKGKKAYLPWTKWSDGVWRQMEPESHLPFWKPPKRKGELERAAIMVHEGAKAAEFVTEMIKNKGRVSHDDPDWKKSPWYEVHPWYDELKNYEHWGMIGGAMAPQRTDYSELVRANPTEVVYVCDNDFFGKKALEAVSFHYGRAMRGVYFTNDFKTGWDLADPMPKKFFKKGKFNGNSLASLYQIATWATEPIPTTGKGRPSYRITDAFAEEWIHCIEPEVFIHKDYPNDILTLDKFNNKVDPFSNVTDTGRLLKKRNATKSYALQYDPSEKSGIYGKKDEKNGRPLFNTHCPSPIRAEPGDASIWEELLEHLVPKESDRTELIRWMATLICRPEVKMNYGILMVSETQGVGKSSIGEKILAPLVGPTNFTPVSEKEIIDSTYNYWQSHKRLAIVHEIYAGHSAKAYNDLKTVITDKKIRVHMKFMAPYEIDNWVHVFACSNSTRALRLSTDDRRWFVPQVVETKKNNKFWTDLNNWLLEDNGLAIIKYWMEEWLKTNEAVRPGAEAPPSSAKEEMIKEQDSDGMALARDMLDVFKEVLRFPREEGEEDPEWARREKLIRGGAPIYIMNGELKGQATWPLRLEKGDRLFAFVQDRDVVDMIKFKLYDDRQNDKLERPQTIRSVARSAGFFPSRTTFYVRDKSWIYKSRIITPEEGMTEVATTELWEPRAGKKFYPLPAKYLLQDLSGLQVDKIGEAPSRPKKEDGLL